MSITAVMLMGAKREPFLGACLDSIRDAVDRLIVNDNSGLAEHPNLSVMRDSELFKTGRVTIIPSTFLGFGPCRDLCLAEMRKTTESGRWVIFVDCDEVHTPSINQVTRCLLPRLPEDIGIVDGYFYQIFQSPDFIKSLDHRHNLMFRFNPEIRWTGQVHEQLSGLMGRRLVVPYRYFHYGYLEPTEVIIRKWQLYGSLGDYQSGRQCEMPNEFMWQEIKKLTAFYGRHPAPAYAAIQAYKQENERWLMQVAEFSRKQPLISLRSRLRFLHIAFKMRWQYLLASMHLLRKPSALAKLDVYR